jgi:hypothetical protein
LLILASIFAFAQTGKHPSESARQLVEQFQRETVVWKQFEVAKKIVALRDKTVLHDLEPWLSNEDRCLRGNAAFVFASLGDNRGFLVIEAIYALEQLNAKEALPKIRALLGDNATIHFDGLIRVADAAREAVNRLEREP